ncbi:uncharacterized protein [Rutidosis leptorrhynchoides]|uniref:uncharacterized protein n=1 Tax=Rutidosis leptorrhynchoides TaxID=125765 RepID=UPI003A9A5C3C
MDAVELPLPDAIVTQIMKPSGCSGGAVNRAELLGNKSEHESCSSSFHPDKDNKCNVNGTRPAIWNKMSDEDMYRLAGQAFLDHDMESVQEAKQSLQNSGKVVRSNGSSSRRSRVAHMEASMNVNGVLEYYNLPKDVGSYSGTYNIAEKKLKTTVSGKRSDKRNGKLPKNKCDSFSVKAGLSSFSSAAGGNNILGIYGSKHDICDFGKQVDVILLNELLDGSYKCRYSINEKEKKTEVLNGSILSSVRDACSIFRLQKPIKIPTAAAVDGAYNHNASCLPNNDNEGAFANLSSCNKVEESLCAPTDDHANSLQFPLVAPKDVLDRLSLPPPKDLDLMLLDSMKPTSTSKVQSGGSLPTFPWSHVSGRDNKANPDVIKSTPSKCSCQGRWVRIGMSTDSLREATSTSYLADFKSLTYNPSLVPLEFQRPVPIGNGKSTTLSISVAASDPGVTPSTQATASKSSAGNCSRELAAAQTLCNIAATCRKQDQEGMASWQKDSSNKVFRASKLTSDEKLEKALFTIPSSRHVGPNNLVNSPNDMKSSHTQKKLKLSTNDFHWSTSTPQSSRSSPSKIFKVPPLVSKHHESSSSLKKTVTVTTPARFSNKPLKLRRLEPMEWKSRGDQKGYGKY